MPSSLEPRLCCRKLPYIKLLSRSLGASLSLFNGLVEAMHTIPKARAAVIRKHLAHLAVQLRLVLLESWHVVRLLVIHLLVNALLTPPH